MLSPILFGSGSSGTTTRPSGGTTSPSGSNAPSATSEPPPSTPSQPSDPATEPSDAADIDDGTYQPTPADEPASSSSAAEADAAAQPEAEAGTAPNEPAVLEEASPGSEQPDTQAVEPAEPAPPASEAAAPSEADAPVQTTSPAPIASAPPVTSETEAQGMSLNDEMEAAALAAYRGQRTSVQNDEPDFAQQVTALVEQNLNRARERALEASQARIIAGLLSGTGSEEKPEVPATSALAAEPERQAVDVAEAIGAYRQA